jgi:hypothetical protein
MPNLDSIDFKERSKYYLFERVPKPDLSKKHAQALLAKWNRLVQAINERHPIARNNPCKKT